MERAPFFFAVAAAAVLLLFRRPSKNFTWAELTTTNTGLQNEPNLEQRVRLILLAREVLQPLRNRFGAIRVTSAFRSGKVNEAVDGAGGDCVRSDQNTKCSYHTTGSAVDLVSLEGASLEQMASWLYGQHQMPLDEVIIEPTWLHISRGSQGAPGKRKFLISRDGKTFLPWEPAFPMVVS